MPAHKLNYDPAFLDWFIGFTEGDGCFAVDAKVGRASFIITQKDPKVLYLIKQSLGFGVVNLHADGYYRYLVSDRTNLQYLINIFKGKLVLSKTNVRFLNWVAVYYKAEKAIDLEHPKTIGLNSAWLSGFIDAEGCFSASQRPGRTTYRMRFTINQKGEAEILKTLPYLAGPDVKLGRLVFSKGDISTFTIDALKHLKHLVAYLEKFPLRSNKNIAYSKWLKLFRVVLDGGRGYSYETIKNMAQEINKFEDEDKVQKLEKD